MNPTKPQIKKNKYRRIILTCYLGSSLINPFCHSCNLWFFFHPHPHEMLYSTPSSAEDFLFKVHPTCWGQPASHCVLSWFVSFRLGDLGIRYYCCKKEAVTAYQLLPRCSVCTVHVHSTFDLTDSLSSSLCGFKFPQLPVLGREWSEL